MSDINHYIEAFSNLHTAKIKGHKAPHKAVLLLAIIDLIEDGVISDPCIKLSEELINKFGDIWQRYIGNSTIFHPEISKPYFHMQHESFWSNRNQRKRIIDGGRRNAMRYKKEGEKRVASKKILC